MLSRVRFWGFRGGSLILREFSHFLISYPQAYPLAELVPFPPLRRLVDRGLMTARFFGPQQILKAARRRKPDLDFPVGVLSIARWARSRAL